MEATTVSALTEALVNILLGTFACFTICWTLTGVQIFFNDRKREKRDEEYHAKRMEELDSIIKK